MNELLGSVNPWAAIAGLGAILLMFYDKIPWAAILSFFTTKTPTPAPTPGPGPTPVPEPDETVSLEYAIAYYQGLKSYLKDCPDGLKALCSLWPHLEPGHEHTPAAPSPVGK